MNDSNYKNENTEIKYLNNVRENRFLKLKNNLLDLKDFIELKNRESKDREVKIQRKIEELFFKQITASIYDKDRFERKDIIFKKWL